MQTSRLFSRHLVLVAAAALVLLLSSLQAEAATRTVLGLGDPSELFTTMTRSYRFSSDVTSFQLEETSAGAGPSLLREVKIGEKDYIVTSSKLANTTKDGWVQVPMAAFALSLIYPVKREALQSAAALSIDTTNLLGIYVGELTTWTDAAPNGWFYMAVPDPSAPITFYVQHYEDEASEFASTQGLLGRALCHLTSNGEHIPNADVFCAAYRSNGNRLIPTLEHFNPGRVVALPIGTTPLELIGSLANSTAGLALSTVSAGVAHDLLSIQIESIAGFLTEDQLNQAVPGVGAIVAGESLAIDILNSKAGWPFSALQFVSVPRESVVRGCAYLQSVADFLVWSHTNNMAIDLITQEPHYAVLNNGIRSIAATSVSTVTCNGQAVVAPAVSAAGPPTLLLNSWASGYESSSGSGSIRLAYETYLFDITNAESATSGLTDVAVTFTYREHNETMPMSTIPVAAEALVAIYNVPEIALSVTGIPLVFSADLAVKIMFGDVRMWNAPEIAALNPELARVLPNETIRLVLDKGGSPFSSGGPSGGPDNRALLSWIHSLVPSFKNTTFPVEADTERVTGAKDSGLTTLIKGMPYSLGWGGLSAALSERGVRIAYHLRSGGTKRQSSNWLAPERGAILATLNDNYSASNPNTTGHMLPALVSQNPDAWPIVRWLYFYTRGNSSATSTAQGIQCTKLAALVDWIYWTQTDTKQAAALADGEGMVSFVSGDSVRSKQLINTLASMQCYGEPVFVLMACVNDGTICSDHGQCQATSQNTTAYQCRCDSGWQGTLCETPVDSDDGGADNLAIGLAVGLSAGVCLILILLVLVGTVPALIVTKFAGRRGRPEWEIRMSDIQNLELIGQGGYGKVYKATWKGTEVAVKVIDRNRQPDTKRARQAFVKEIEHMSLLRNPNIVMFMAAATSTVPMCIVMEYMALGSLYDLLHNELIDHMPFQLKSLILLHIARGMNFLHSSDVVHRDLKSLNVLLDSKWNAKVADFGLSTLGSGPRDRAQFEGSVPWAAPEILNEQNDADLFAADVYSFGIITWEVLTRDQPYRGKSPAAVAVAVLRDKCRPPIATQEEYGTLYLERDNLELLPYVETVVCLIESCWSEEVSVRPTFLEITSNLANLVSRVKAVHNGGSSTSGMMTGSMTSSSDYSGGGYGGMGRDNSSRSHGSSTNSKNSMDRNTYEPRRGNALRRYHYYDGPHAIVCSDVAMAGTLWSNVPEAMKDATRLHNELLRSLLARYGGYETMLPKIEGGAAGTFCMAFATTADALLWCADVQRALLEADWPAPLLQCPPAEELNAGGLDDKLIFRGLRVRMGVHHGTPRCHIDSLTHHIEYTGPAVQKTQELASRAAGGVVLLSAEAYNDLKRDRASAGSVIEGGSRIRALLDTMADEGATLYELVLPGLEARCLRTVVKDTMPLHRRRLLEGSAANKARLASARSAYDSSSSDSDSDSEDDRRNDSKVVDLNTSLSFIDPLASASMSMVHDDRGHRPDHRKEPVELGFLNSANMCRTIINYREILVEKPIGSGSFGIVHKARWKGVPVAVKTLTAKKRLSEEDMLDFRYEIAVLADLNHLNVLAFIGACLNEPHLAIVTEYMGRGSLRDVLHSTSSKLPWPMRLRMLRDAADGVRYLHTRASPIIHRDLKSSNLLVDDNWTVKVGDFGLARIKGDNATMTRCGTPAWTAPEVLSSNTYDEKADVYSFGVVMWEVLTRRQPYEGRNFIKVTMDVLKGDRPTIPADCPSDFSKLMRKCWHANPHKRPAMESVVSAIEHMMQGHDDEQVPSTLIIADNV